MVIVPVQGQSDFGACLQHLRWGVPTRIVAYSQVAGSHREKLRKRGCWKSRWKMNRFFWTGWRKNWEIGLKFWFFDHSSPQIQYAVFPPVNQTCRYVPERNGPASQRWVPWPTSLGPSTMQLGDSIDGTLPLMGVFPIVSYERTVFSNRSCVSNTKSHFPLKQGSLLGEEDFFHCYEITISRMNTKNIKITSVGWFDLRSSGKSKHLSVSRMFSVLQERQIKPEPPWTLQIASGRAVPKNIRLYIWHSSLLWVSDNYQG